MHSREKEKATVMNDCKTIYYEVMSFDIKNVGATYQRLMDYIFKGMFGQNVEVYIEAKSDSCLKHIQDLKEV